MSHKHEFDDKNNWLSAEGMETADTAVLFPAVVTGGTDAGSGHLKENNPQHKAQIFTLLLNIFWQKHQIVKSDSQTMTQTVCCVGVCVSEAQLQVCSLIPASEIPPFHHFSPLNLH